MALLFNILFFLHVGDLREVAVDDLGMWESVSFSYNYVPLVSSIFMTLAGLGYIPAVVIPAIIFVVKYFKKDKPEIQDEQEMIPPAVE